MSSAFSILWHLQFSHLNWTFPKHINGWLKKQNFSQWSKLKTFHYVLSQWLFLESLAYVCLFKVIMMTKALDNCIWNKSNTPLQINFFFCIYYSHKQTTHFFQRGKVISISWNSSVYFNFNSPALTGVQSTCLKEVASSHGMLTPEIPSDQPNRFKTKSVEQPLQHSCCISIVSKLWSQQPSQHRASLAGYKIRLLSCRHIEHHNKIMVCSSHANWPTENGYLR